MSKYKLTNEQTKQATAAITKSQQRFKELQIARAFYEDAVQHEKSVLKMICDIHDIKPVEGMQITDDGYLVLPETHTQKVKRKIGRAKLTEKSNSNKK